jgi:hypothetical protein
MLKFNKSNDLSLNVSAKECLVSNVVSKVTFKNNSDMFFGESSFLDLELSNNDNFNDIGVVVSVGDGIARVRGLDTVRAGELVVFFPSEIKKIIGKAVPNA